MSVSPFPPSQSAMATQSTPPRSRQPSAHHTPTQSGDEPFSSAAAYRNHMSPVASPPPQVTYERASAIHSPPPASNLVIHDPHASATPSPAPNGSAAVSPAVQRAGGDGRSAKFSAAASSKRDGTASISKSARSSATSWLYGGPDSFIRVPSRMAALYILVTTIEAIIVITLVGYIFGKIVAEVDNFTQNLKTVSVYLAVFVFGSVFQVLIAWDAVRLKNTLQLIGVLIFNIALTITAAIEIRQVRDALNAQDQIAGGYPCPDNPNRLCRARSLFPQVETYLIVVTATCFVAEFFMIYLSYKLWREFGWIVYQKIGADLKVRNMFFWYQLFIVFIKFTFFFGVGFTVIYLILVADTTDWEYGVTIAAVPIAMVALFVAGFSVRREWSSLMVVSLLLMIVGLVYFVYKLTQVWVPATRDEYTYVHTTITFISGFAILTLSLTLLNGFICLLNFHKGLKPAHDAIGTFGGVHRPRARNENEGGDVLDIERDVEPKEHSNGSTPAPMHRGSVVSGGVVDPRRGSGMVHSPVYSNGAHETPAFSPAMNAYTAPPTAATLGNAPVLAPQPVQAAIHDPAFAPAPAMQAPAMHAQPAPTSQQFLDAHAPRPSATRISLD
ncbi:hypothetical protein PANT_9d00014 [Moesziomyces antarcticus T-34]|uniref:Uncharacterized protein n=1 Tax=Pseudozyma antarctica (strain T-34) TaxID=1151754 RepID=M9MC55_PSEA3|nr:hypothetical protein PANT_9d00014 [Moesziomyces antarcticus T-34]